MQSNAINYRLPKAEIKQFANSIVHERGFELSSGASRWFNSAGISANSVRVMDLLASEKAFDFPTNFSEAPPLTYQAFTAALVMTRFRLLYRLRQSFIHTGSPYVKLSEQAKDIVSLAIETMPAEDLPFPLSRARSFTELTATYGWYRLMQWAIRPG